MGLPSNRNTPADVTSSGIIAASVGVKHFWGPILGFSVSVVLRLGGRPVRLMKAKVQPVSVLSR